MYVQPGVICAVMSLDEWLNYPAMLLRFKQTCKALTSLRVYVDSTERFFKDTEMCGSWHRDIEVDALIAASIRTLYADGAPIRCVCICDKKYTTESNYPIYSWFYAREYLYGDASLLRMTNFDTLRKNSTLCECVYYIDGIAHLVNIRRDTIQSMVVHIATRTFSIMDVERDDRDLIEYLASAFIIPNYYTYTNPECCTIYHLTSCVGPVIAEFIRKYSSRGFRPDPTLFDESKYINCG